MTSWNECISYSSVVHLDMPTHLRSSQFKPGQKNQSMPAAPHNKPLTPMLQTTWQ